APEAAMRTDRPVVLEAVPRGPGVTPRGALAPGGPAAFVPLAARGRALGVLAVLGAPGERPLGAEAVQMVQGFASQAAMALEYAAAQRELQRLALLDERERIAKELHDGVIQSLFAVGMGLQAIASLAGPAEVERHIESAVGELDHVIGDLRNYIFALRPGILADHGLDQALRRLAVDFEARCGVPTTIQIDEATAERLADRAPDLVQLTREALSNVGRHARAGTCRVRLRRVRATAVLTVDDDGTGFDPTAPRAGGQGLRNMEERMARVGGRVVIRSRPAQGTSLRVTLPLG
ncbi:MAG TPA: GAF domain-containing sensor histidine kinase, partial [Candidatus Dormibacteraeota bacterium]|nr:GAF domain-containing sensor histidine kinase [Candidatus Dormibacteraeota bacterium]